MDLQLQKEKQSRTTWSFERKDGPAWEDSGSWKTKAERDNAGAGTTTVTIPANENKNASSAETLYGNYRLSTRDQYATSAKTMVCTLRGVTDAPNAAVVPCRCFTRAPLLS